MLGQTTHVRLDHLGNPIMKGPFYLSAGFSLL
jgi:hypothetical protein